MAAWGPQLLKIPHRPPPRNDPGLLRLLATRRFIRDPFGTAGRFASHTSD
jgi:hypothetical protein